MKNRFYEWVASQLTVEWWHGQLTRSLTVRVRFKNTVISQVEYDNSGNYRLKLISSDGNLHKKEKAA